MKCTLAITTLLLSSILFGCKQDRVYPEYITEYVIIVVIDGPRYTETWGELSHSFIPYQSQLRHQGVIFNNFSNEGPTYTIAGHTAITTGNYQWISNTGQELPANPSIFQAWREEHSTAMDKAWVIASKDKLEVIANTSNSSWNNKFMPSTNCGNNGLGTGYRHDSITLVRSLEVFDQHHPNLVLINFREPDFSAHQSNWPNYLAGISKTDEYVQQIWDYIQNDPIYKDKTTLLVTNDHGRHENGVSIGFAGHGDNCNGCRKISLLALGPDFPQDLVVSKHYNQTDIARTIADLLHFNLNKGKGNRITELLD
ncbi:MAG: alkaline phosphatase family protein [Crocinitomicaceae bacterium]|nr:alkaline phosphatase family protein [Crocinitomicaceae bacterium]